MTMLHTTSGGRRVDVIGPVRWWLCDGWMVALESMDDRDVNAMFAVIWHNDWGLGDLNFIDLVDHCFPLNLSHTYKHDYNDLKAKVPAK